MQKQLLRFAPSHSSLNTLVIFAEFSEIRNKTIKMSSHKRFNDGLIEQIAETLGNKTVSCAHF